MRNRVVALFLAASSVLLLPFPGRSQSGNASVTGTVNDSTSAVIPGAEVRITNTATGVVKTTRTTPAGLYMIPDLIPGPYVLEGSASGFATERVTGIQLEVDQQAQVNLTLQVGSQKSEVTVKTANTELLQTVDASVGTVINSQSVVNLPLNGRYFTQLLELSPGTTPGIRNYGLTNSNPQLLGHQRNGLPSFQVNGQSGAFTNFRIDGIENTEREFGGANIPVSVDAIDEFKLQTANFSAEYGRGPSQVDLVTKSGTNQIHGSLFEFFRNTDLDATQWTFTGSHTGDLLHRNQFGGTVGGPILRDKFFYFFSYDGTREVYTVPQLVSVPSLDERKGIFPIGNPIFDPNTGQPFPSNTIPQSRFDAVAAKVLNVLRAPNLPGVNNYNSSGQLISQTQNYRYIPKHSQSIDQYNVRLDYTLSERNSITGRYTYSPNNIVADGPLATNLQSSIVGSEIDNLGGQNLSVAWFHNFSPTTINEVRFGFLTDPQSYIPGDTTNYAAQFGLSSALPSNAFTGLPHFKIGSINIGSGDYRPLKVSEHDYQVVDNFTLIRGTHSFRIGADIQPTQLETENSQLSKGLFSFNGAQTRNRATVTYNGTSYNLASTGTTYCPGGTNPTACTAGNAAADFLLGYVQQFSVGTPIPPINKYEGLWSGYFNDTWKIRSNLTLELGLRYEYWQKPRANPNAYAIPVIQNGQFTGKIGVATVNGQLTPKLPAQANALTPGAFVGCPSLGLPSGCLLPEKNDWQPRVGFAWSVTPKTVVRSGFGVFYGYLGGDQQTELGTNNYPFSIFTSTPSYTQPPKGSAPPPLFLNNPLATAQASAPSLKSNPANLKRPSEYQMNFTIERELPATTTISAAYVGALARHLEDQNDWCCYYDIPQPWGVVLPAGQTAVQPYPQFAFMELKSSQDNSSYQSFQVKATNRFNQGLTFTAAYTYSKLTGAIVGWSDPRFPNLDHGPLDGDLRHSLVVSYVWQLPFGTGRRFVNTGGLLNTLIGGWQFTNIISKRTGFPFTPTLSGTQLIGLIPKYHGQERPDRVCSGTLSDPSVQNWFNKACFVLPSEPTTPGAILHEGNSGPNVLYGPGSFNMDMGLSKFFSITERTRLEFRSEAFNVLNHPSFALPDAAINPSANSNTPARITNTTSLPRIIQFALKLTF
ncbi:MAG: TonB-dependent receptor [Acidobacteriaceae bacterium]|nr:TonB-dependent receptor [Acidobacteriaceae bacterium]